MEFNRLLEFLSTLKKNNTKEWFDANRAEYEQLRNMWLDFVLEQITHVAKFDPQIGQLDPKKCIFRINRDVRFSKNKDPYKVNFGMSLSKTGKRDEFCGYYLHIEPGKSFIAGGVYMPMPDKLAAIRQEIDYNADLFRSIIGHKSFVQQFGKLDGEQLTRPPKGYDAGNPAIEWLKYKSFIGTRYLTDKQVKEVGFSKEIHTAFKALKPLNDFLYVAYE